MLPAISTDMFEVVGVRPVRCIALLLCRHQLGKPVAVPGLRLAVMRGCGISADRRRVRGRGSRNLGEEAAR